MKQDLKNEWIEALRSGKYHQGQGRLYCSQTHSYCCLGVLSSLCIRQGLASTEEDAWLATGSYLSTEIQKVADISEANPWVQVTFTREDWTNAELRPILRTIHPHTFTELFRLSSLNDKGLTFNTIAALLEKGEIVKYR